MYKYEFCDDIYTEKMDGVTRFRIDACNLEKWLHQNKADYIGDYFDGCLLDNFDVSTKRGYAFIYENYVNSNMSDYLVEFAPYKAKKAVEYLFEKWDRNVCHYLDMLHE